MSIRNASIGPQCYGRRSDAVVCVYSGKAGRFADIFHHVCEGDDAKWPLLEPHVIFRTEICLRILKKKHCNSGSSFQGRASEPCSHRFGLPFRRFLLLSRHWVCH